jgi:hypothetical protein
MVDMTVTRQSKAYLKFGIGAVIIISKLVSPSPLFWSWDNAEGVGYNVATLGFIGIALALMIWGIMDIRKGATK